MYEVIYSDSFFVNFITTSVFLFLILIFCFSKFYINNKSILIFGEFQPIILFFVIFNIIAFAFNFIIYLNIYIYFKYFLYFLIFCFFLIWLYLGKKVELSVFNKKIFLGKKKYIILLFFIIFYLISILPISDADSIAIHQNLANYIYLNGLEAVNLKKNFEFTTLANSEILLILSPILKSDNFGSQLNFFSLLLFYYIFYKHNKSFIFFIFSCPLIIFLISTQKLQLFFAILYLTLFIILHQNLLKKKIEIFLFILLLFFYASAKISYILIALPLYSYLLISHKKNLGLILIYSIVIFFIFFIPIFLVKLKFFGNPVSPFFGSFFNVNDEFINSFSLNLRSAEGWLNNVFDPKIFLKPFIPLTINNLTSSLGFLFLFQLFNFSLLKKTKFIPIIIIFIVLLTGQLLPRYYFEAFLILSFFYTVENNRLVSWTKFLQASVILILSLTFVFISYFKTNVVLQKHKFMNQFSDTFYDSKQFDNLNITNNILAFTQDRQSLFFKNNIYGTRGIVVKSLTSDWHDAMLSFFEENSINYVISENVENFPKCVVLNKIGDIYQKKAIRNFLINKSKKNYNIYLLDTNNCGL